MLSAACLRCRARKTRCQGRNGCEEHASCASCREADVPCVVVHHRRGRKVGTKLSQQVRERLRKKPRDSTGRCSTPVPTGSNSAGLGDSQSLAHLPSVPLQADVTLTHAQEGDIGPTVRGASSIERLFAPRSVGPSTRDTGAAFRSDPIGYGYMDEAMARDLFAFFMSVMSRYLFIFDPELHTYAYVSTSSSFLFSVIIAVAAKYMPSVPSLVYKRCLALAKSHISKVFTDGFKDEEAIIALFTMTEYKEASDENGYLLLGIACRLAVDLELQKPAEHNDARRNRNRHRIWLALYAADRRYNYCGQTAKPTMMPDDGLVRSCEQFRQSHLCLTTDRRLAGNVKLRRIMSSYIETFDSELGRMQSRLSYRALYDRFVLDVDQWRADEQLEVEDPVMLVNIATYTLHAKVVIAHRWLREVFRDFEHRTGAAPTVNDERRDTLHLCIQGSISILMFMLEMPDDGFRYCGDSKHLYFAYASFLLYKTLKTETASQILDPAEMARMFHIISESAVKLDRSALAPSHTAAYHANFLRSLLDFRPKGRSEPVPSTGTDSISMTGYRPASGTQLSLVDPFDIDAAIPLWEGEHAHTTSQTTMLRGERPPPQTGSPEQSAEPDGLLWDDWWPLDNNLLDQGTLDTLTNDPDVELQNILDALFET